VKFSAKIVHERQANQELFINFGVASRMSDWSDISIGPLERERKPLMDPGFCSRVRNSRSESRTKEGIFGIHRGISERSDISNSAAATRVPGSISAFRSRSNISSFYDSKI
jgi:hypothetical protein